MGLDTSHGAWSGAYSSFMEWRAWLNVYLMEERHRIVVDNTREAIKEAWTNHEYDDQTIPINVLMNHSDCDGIIDTNICEAIADKLEQIVENHPLQIKRHLDDTEQFIQGLQRAADSGEDLEFH